MDVSMTALIGFVGACFLAATTAAAFRVGIRSSKRSA
jgi:hypothetical protein